ncbi:hypothetical protein [Kurthia huakuii]|uniref:hypothetical protein n=1 Tax=Kurthia huakuii TaxID=1421019 RepID=UPI000497D70E|nr:hypothetical protein [Kurthia huakuii]MBM7698145.1 hypothetical protein [Kurthia huakuii]
MHLFKMKHADGIHIIDDVKKHKNNLQLQTITGEELFIIAVTDDSYTVYDDRFAGASKQLNSIEAFDINGSFRSLDFDNMRALFTKAFDHLLEHIATLITTEALVDLDELKEQISVEVPGIHFKIISNDKPVLF